MMDDKAEKAAIHLKNRCIIGSAKSSGARRDRCPMQSRKDDPEPMISCHACFSNGAPDTLRRGWQF